MWRVRNAIQIRHQTRLLAPQRALSSGSHTDLNLRHDDKLLLLRSVFFLVQYKIEKIISPKIFHPNDFL